jgi:predicted transcriptional regulator
MERIIELKPQEKKEPELSSTMELLNEAHCRILATLLESSKPYSKKELAKAAGATYKRVLKAIDELEKLGRAQGEAIALLLGMSTALPIRVWM